MAPKTSQPGFAYVLSDSPLTSKALSICFEALRNNAIKTVKALSHKIREDEVDERTRSYHVLMSDHIAALFVLWAAQNKLGNFDKDIYTLTERGMEVANILKGSR